MDSDSQNRYTPKVYRTGGVGFFTVLSLQSQVLRKSLYVFYCAAFKNAKWHNYDMVLYLRGLGESLVSGLLHGIIILTHIKYSIENK